MATTLSLGSRIHQWNSLVFPRSLKSPRINFVFRIAKCRSCWQKRWRSATGLISWPRATGNLSFCLPVMFIIWHCLLLLLQSLFGLIYFSKLIQVELDWQTLILWVAVLWIFTSQTCAFPVAPNHWSKCFYNSVFPVFARCKSLQSWTSLQFWILSISC